MAVLKHLLDLPAQRGEFQEHFVEGAIAEIDSLVSAEHDERMGNRVKDRLRSVAIVHDLIYTVSESSYISERQHDAADVAVGLCVGGYPDHEPLGLVAEIGAGFCPAGDNLAATLFQTGRASEHPDVAGRPANV